MSVRNRGLGVARLDFLSGLRNHPIARPGALNFLSDLRNRALFFFAACGGGENKSQFLTGMTAAATKLSEALVVCGVHL